MHRVHRLLPGALVELLRPAPLSAGKVEFAWRTAVGSALDRVTRVRLQAERTLEVDVTDKRWRREVERSSSLVLSRLERLLGPGVIERIVVRVTEPWTEE